MVFNLDEKRITTIFYKLENGDKIVYQLENGEIVCAEKIKDGETYKKKKDAKPLTDSEMIEAVRKSSFMDELASAKKRFKIGKEIVKDFSKTDTVFNKKDKRTEDECSEESFKIAQEIIKMDREGKLDNILARKRGLIDRPLKTAIKRENNPLSQDSSTCCKNIKTIEEKILDSLRVGDREKLEKLIEDYNFYRGKKEEIDNKLWDETVDKIE